MANDKLPNEMDIYRVGRAIGNNPSLATILLRGMAGTSYLTQHPTSTPAIDVDFPNRLSPEITDSEREGLMQDIANVLAKYREKFRNTSSRDATMQDLTSRPMAVAWKLAAGFSEAILGKYPRDVVSSKEVMIDGLLRGVVKITVSFQEGYVVTGSGVLINDRTVATVGHLLINTHGHAKGVVIQAGHGGGDDTMESRDGIYVAVHGKWYYEKRSDPNDLGFIRLSKPFNTVNPIEYMRTPIIHDGTDAAIYGYPFDMPENEDARGNRLCVSRSAVRYRQSDSTGMLEHEGDTEKGTSGGPVLDANGIVIALHRGWAPDGSDEGVNQAIAIDRNGNDFWAFCLILEYMSQREDDRVKMLGEVKEVDGFAFAW
ncbi:hypothetical protein EKO27_g7254 [Xylaria grammica]|uniref:Serine protease n=1 Tax=Xylaria grammica TaxID=363999 RepID=A0A439D087_9PEZI|nr:hypothetical protein EKO27_g7254 [Xylaria grammica]